MWCLIKSKEHEINKSTFYALFFCYAKKQLRSKKIPSRTPFERSDARILRPQAEGMRNSA